MVNEKERKFNHLNTLGIDGIDVKIVEDLESNLYNNFTGSTYFFNDDGTGVFRFKNGNTAYFSFDLKESQMELTGDLQAKWWSYTIDNGELAFYVNRVFFYSSKKNTIHY
ncbi:hypothetical protein [Zunongwangia sp.]|uniref:hypothetical protein n=1 Tax=Zunongwangia sp. TaxID=1965325 RepID=UPI003AA81FFA